MSWNEIQAEVDSWISQFQEGYFPPLSMLARLTEETGELARAVSLRFGAKKPKPGEPQEDIADEICDVLFVAICMANSLHIDLDKAFASTMHKVRTRDANRWTPKG